MHTCETCGNEWPESYCPQCGHTIGKAASPAAPPPLPAPKPAARPPHIRPMMYIVLLTLAVVVACLIPAFLNWKRRQHDERLPSVLELRKDIRAAAGDPSQVPEKALALGDDLTAKLALREEKKYGPLGKTTDEILSHERDDKKDDVYFALLWRIGQKIDRNGWDHLTDTERRLVAVQALEGEVLNGGFDQYFFNSTGNDAEVALAGLKDIGAKIAASLLERAMAVFPGGRPPADRQQRWKAMDQIKSSSKPVWEKCDDEFYKFQEDLSQMSLAYARTNRAQIILP